MRKEGKKASPYPWDADIGILRQRTRAALWAISLRRTGDGMLPMIPSVYAALKLRHEEAGKPEAGWMFPSASREGHFNKDTAKDQRAKAIQRANEKAKKNSTRQLVFFQPYVLRTQL